MRAIKCLLLSGVFLVAASAWGAFPYPDTLPDGSINVGRAYQFTSLSAGDTNLDKDTTTGHSFIGGNVGVGGNANFSMTGDATIDGNLYMNAFGKFKMTGKAHFTPGHGVIYGQDNLINGAMDDSYMLSSSAAMDTSTGAYTVTMGSFNGMTVNTNKSFTLTGTGKIVLNLQDLVLKDKATFTLQGTATTTFIVNVSRNFSLSSSAQIVLSGGLQASHVLFNVVGTGSQVSLSGHSSLTGILLAAQRKIELNGGSSVYGKVIGNQVNVTGSSQIVSQ